MDSDSDKSHDVSQFIQGLGLSSLSNSILDLESISEGSTSSLSTFSSLDQLNQHSNVIDASPSRYNLGSLRTYENQLNQKDIIIEAIRQKHHEQLDALHEKLRETDSAIAFIKQKFDEKIQQLNMKAEQEKEQIRKEAQAEIERLKQLNKARRDGLTFAKLPQLTKDEYDQLTTQAPSTLTLPQFLAVQLFEYNQNNINQSNQISGNLTKLQKENEKLRSQITQINSELSSEKELRLSLESRLSSVSARRSTPTSVPPAPDQNAKIERIENERAELRGAYQVSLARLNEVSEQRDEAIQRSHDLESDLSRAQLEITSLQAQLKSVQTLAERQEGILSQQYLDIAELKKTRDEFFNRYVQTSESRRNELGQLLQNEVEKLSERSKSDVEFVRGVTEKMRDREIQLLTQSHDQALTESKQLRLDLRKAEEDRAKLQAEYQTLQLTHEAEITRISADLRVKSYELERVKLVYEELKSAQDDIVDERDALSSKFDVVRQEVMRLENEIKIKDQEIKQLSDKVAMYDKLENELDIAVESLDLNSVGPIAVPSDANRRIKQSVQLAKRVMQLTQANSKLTAECEDLKAQLVNYSQQLEDAKQQLNAAGQPQQVFLSMINEKQTEITKLKKRLASMSEMNQELIKNNEDIKRDMGSMKTQNDGIQATKQLVECPYSSNLPTRGCFEPSPFVVTRFE